MHVGGALVLSMAVIVTGSICACFAYSLRAPRGLEHHVHSVAAVNLNYDSSASRYTDTWAGVDGAPIENRRARAELSLAVMTSGQT